MDIDNTSESIDNSISKKLKGSQDVSSSDPFKSTSVVESEGSYHDDEDDYCDDDEDYGDDYDYLSEEDDADDYSKIHSLYDNVELPSGVEASIPWLKDPSPSENTSSAISNPTSSVNLPATPGIEIPIASAIAAAAASSLTIFRDGSQENILEKLEAFKTFDTIEEFSDHHYSSNGESSTQLSRDWSKKIQGEWKILENNLPETIFVRVCETRMDLLRAVIVGPAGTPYHDGLFTFDCFFPPEYPSVPPMVFYYSGGLRLNPNLYACGKVCLSLLGTWSGKSTEMWIPKESTMLQVLVSIQALILNAEPFYNEPGYEMHKGRDGDTRSKDYNENTFVLSLKTMVYTIRRPPRHFENLVIGHFLKQAHDILLACKAYMKGAKVGSLVLKEEIFEQKSVSLQFHDALCQMMNALISLFTKNGSKDLPKV